jgi:hypothetical protein
MTRSLPVLWLAVASTACGTAFSGVRHDVRVSASPSDARISLYRLDGERVAGPAPASGELKDTPRPKHEIPYLAVVSHEGYCPHYQLTRIAPTPGMMAETLLLAIPFIQLIGVATMAVDHSTGGCCSVSPIEAVLEPEEMCR